MSGTTARFGLYTITLGTDLVSYTSDFTNNWAAIDLVLGSQVCTSSTRPSAPVTGLVITETDKSMLAFYNGSAWDIPQGRYRICTSSTRPTGTDLFTGQEIYETNTQAIAVYTGSAWQYTSTVICTSTTHPTTGIVSGTSAFETDTKREIVYNGSSWQEVSYGSFVCTSATHPASPYTGLEILETDTSLSAIYNGTSYLYNWTQLQPTQSVTNQPNITFSSLPAVGTVKIVWKLRGLTAASAVSLDLQLNGDTASHYVWQNNQANTNAAVSGINSGGAVGMIQVGTIPAASATANYYGAGEITIPHWNDTTNFAVINATGSGFISSTSAYSGTYSGLYDQATTLTSIAIYASTGNISGTAAVYGCN